MKTTVDSSCPEPTHANYPSVNSRVLRTVVKHQDARGAEVSAERNTPVGKKVTFIDTYATPPLR
jgi:hypothetical protein